MLGDILKWRAASVSFLCCRRSSTLHILLLCILLAQPSLAEFTLTVDPKPQKVNEEFPVSWRITNGNGGVEIFKLQQRHAESDSNWVDIGDRTSTVNGAGDVPVKINQAGTFEIRAVDADSENDTGAAPARVSVTSQGGGSTESSPSSTTSTSSASSSSSQPTSDSADTSPPRPASPSDPSQLAPASSLSDTETLLSTTSSSRFSTSSLPVTAPSTGLDSTLAATPQMPLSSSFSSSPSPSPSPSSIGPSELLSSGKRRTPIIVGSVVGGVVLLLLLVAGGFFYRRRARIKQSRAVSFYRDKLTRPPTALEQPLNQKDAIETSHDRDSLTDRGSTARFAVEPRPAPRFSGSLTDRQMEIRELIFALQKQMLSLADETASGALLLKGRINRLEEIISEDWALGRTDERPIEMKT